MGAAIFASLTIAGLNYRSSSKLETATFNLVNTKALTIIDQELITIIHSLPKDLQSLSKEHRSKLYYLISVYSTLESFKHAVMSIRDRVTRSIFICFFVGVLAPLSGFLYESNNWLLLPALLIAFFLLPMYIVWGIYPIITIRAVEHANRRLLEAETISELDEITTDILESQFGYKFREVLL